MGIVEVDWHTERDIRRDGSIRPYNQKYSTIHGWVTKLRGTLLDNETVRREGIREMRAAKAVRQWKKKNPPSKRKAGGSSSGGGVFSFLGLGSKKRSSSRAVVKRDSSRRDGKKGGSPDTTLHFSHRSTSRRGTSSSKVSGSITHSRTTSRSNRPAPPQRRYTEAPKRQPSSSHSPRPTRNNTRRSTRP
ncbi:hypothetical protein BDW22DRAFT_1351067 [Trametopsis cervina]|nr:hypothetical protein BDW22DRAFT_1351067 [Trametopsis cervina]